MAGGCSHGMYWLNCPFCRGAAAPAVRVQEADEQPEPVPSTLAQPVVFDCYHGVPENLPCGACAAEIDPASSIETTLAQRGSRYGKFTGHAKIAQGMKQVMVDSPNWLLLDPDQREALEMVAHKIGRILNGDPHYHDSWHDIVGYAKLVADRLEPEAAQ